MLLITHPPGSGHLPFPHHSACSPLPSHGLRVVVLSHLEGPTDVCGTDTQLQGDWGHLRKNELADLIKPLNPRMALSCDRSWGLDLGRGPCKGSGVGRGGGQAPGAEKNPSPRQTGSVWFSKGTRFREVLGKAEECSTGPLGRGREGSNVSQGFHCVPSTPAGPTVAQSLGSSQRNKKWREGKGEWGGGRHWDGAWERGRGGGAPCGVTEASQGGRLPRSTGPPSIQ